MILRQLVRFWSRPTGSYECEVFAYQTILRKAKSVMLEANEIHYIELEVHRPSGCTKHNLFHDFYFCYKNVTNVLVRFGSSIEPKKSILLTCNYDTWPNSGGATDNAVSCAIMLELMLVLSHRSDQLPYDIIFLFSGAQYLILQGAHGFITTHPWGRYVSVYIALQGAGAGSDELVYTLSGTSRWLLELYKMSVPYLHVKTLTHAVRGSGIFAKEMDYRVFEGFPIEEGMEISSMANEYLFRSECDAAPLLRHEPIQRTGENILAFIEAILWGRCLDKRCVTNMTSEQFDILGILTVSYYYRSAGMFYSILLLLAPLIITLGIDDDHVRLSSYALILTHCTCSRRQFFDAMKVQLIALSVVVMSTIVSFVILQEYDAHSYWFGWHYSLLIFYVGPAVLLGLGIHLVNSYFCDKKTLAERMANEQSAFVAAVLVFWFTALIMASLRLHCTYSVALSLLVLLIRNPLLWLTKILRLSCYKEPTPRTMIRCHGLLCCVALLLVYDVVIDVAMIIIPGANRIRPTLNPEMILAALTLFISGPFVLLTSAVVYMSARMKWWAYMGTVWIFALVTALVSSVSAPYKQSLTNPRLNLIFIQHYSVTNCSGPFVSCSTQHFIWLLPMGVRGYTDLPKWHWLEPGKVTACMEADTYCSLPYFFPRKDLYLPNSTILVPLREAPFFPKNYRLSVQFKDILINPQVVEYALDVKGTDHITAHLTPIFPWELFNWTINVPMQRQNETAFIFLVCNHSPCSWNFTVVLKCEQCTTEDVKWPVLKLQIVSHHVHGQWKYSPLLARILENIINGRLKSDLSFNDAWKARIAANAWSSEMKLLYL
uniref:FXNA-like protease n=1 Tax=Trichuris muris TaxID=70415 RepID=A0A5S6QM54_TRIMR